MSLNVDESDSVVSCGETINTNSTRSSVTDGSDKCSSFIESDDCTLARDDYTYTPSEESTVGDDYICA